jgi:two-component system cell cycle sensor histidine kinase/response regulator CckA
MDLYEAARTEHPGLEQRFIFMTGGAFTLQSAKLLASVPNPCVGKPFDGDELLRAIGDVLDKHVPAGPGDLQPFQSDRLPKLS